MNVHPYGIRDLLLLVAWRGGASRIALVVGCPFQSPRLTWGLHSMVVKTRKNRTGDTPAAAQDQVFFGKFHTPRDLEEPLAEIFAEAPLYPVGRIFGAFGVSRYG